jgi:hypothetical protein
MSIRMPCPNCITPCILPDDSPNKLVSCSGCGHLWSCPAQSLATVPEAPSTILNPVSFPASFPGARWCARPDGAGVRDGVRESTSPNQKILARWLVVLSAALVGALLLAFGGMWAYWSFFRPGQTESGMAPHRMTKSL